MVIHKPEAPGQTQQDQYKLKIAKLAANCPPQSCTALLYFSRVFFLYFFTAVPPTQMGIDIGTVVGVVAALVVVIIIMGVVIGVLVSRNRCNKLSVQQHAM